MVPSPPRATAPSRRSSRRLGQALGHFPCNQCGKSFTRIENLTRHANNHNNIPRFVCHVCQKHFTRSDLLKRHSKIHGKSTRPARGADLPEPGTPVDSSFQDTSQTQSHQLDPIVPELSHTQTEITPDLSQVQSRRNLDTDYPYGINSSLYSAENLQLQRQVPESHHNLHNDGVFLGNQLSPSRSLIIPSQDSPGSGPFWNSSYQGMYGEGCLDSDIAWILDVFPAEYDDDHEPYNEGSFDPPRVGVNSRPQSDQAMSNSVSRLNGPHARLENDQMAEHPYIDSRNDWPDEAEVPGGASPPRTLSANLHGHGSWVDLDEIMQFQEAHTDRLDQNSRVPPELRITLWKALAGTDSIEHGLLSPYSSNFPTPEVLEYFLRLFFQFVYPRFPVLHQATFTTSSASPSLLLGMMLLGSSYSKSNRGKFVHAYLHPTTTIFMKLYSLDPSFLRKVDNILALLFLCVSGTWSGHKSGFEFAEGARGILVTACRRTKLLDCRPRPSLSGPTSRTMRARLHDTWTRWIEQEQRKRLGLSINMFDLQFPALFHNQPYISKGETVNLVLPCDSEFWNAKSPEAWKVLLGPAETPSATYFMVPLDTCLLYPEIQREPPYAPIDSFGKTLLMYALFAHIFEWRQSLSIVLHSAFIRGPESAGPGEGLIDRQRWLRNGLKAWLDVYNHRDAQKSKGLEAPPAALLLYHLANVYLDINISDLHLYAGRSGLTEDVDLAEDSLRRWCQSSSSSRTVDRVQEMLDLARVIIEQGVASMCGFEISIVLFTGGLISWMYSRLSGKSTLQGLVKKASLALEELCSWGICRNFAQILRRFEE